MTFHLMADPIARGARAVRPFRAYQIVRAITSRMISLVPP